MSDAAGKRPAAKKRPAGTPAAARTGHDALGRPLERCETGADRPPRAAPAAPGLASTWSWYRSRARSVPLIGRISDVTPSSRSRLNVRRAAAGLAGRSGERSLRAPQMQLPRYARGRKARRADRSHGAAQCSELVPKILRQRHLRAPAVDACTPLRAIRTSQAVGPHDAMARDDDPNRLRAQNVPAARCAFGRPASAASSPYVTVSPEGTRRSVSVTARSNSLARRDRAPHR